MSVPTVRNLSTGQQAAKSVTSVPGGKWRLSRRAGFWAVAASFLALTAFSTAPSPLYGLYQHQDGLSSITITVVYAVYAAGVVAKLAPSRARVRLVRTPPGPHPRPADRPGRSGHSHRLDIAARAAPAGS